MEGSSLFDGLCSPLCRKRIDALTSMLQHLITKLESFSAYLRSDISRYEIEDFHDTPPFGSHPFVIL